MSEREKIEELLARVEALDGPDRDIDLALAQALVPDVIVGRQRDDDSGYDPYTHWQYTGRIDDALALVERVMPGTEWSRSPPDGGPCHVSLWRMTPRTARQLANAAAETTQGAILSALLTALLRSLTSDREGQR